MKFISTIQTLIEKYPNDLNININEVCDGFYGILSSITMISMCPSIHNSDKNIENIRNRVGSCFLSLLNKKDKINMNIQFKFYIDKNTNKVKIDIFKKSYNTKYQMKVSVNEQTYYSEIQFRFNVNQRDIEILKYCGNSVTRNVEELVEYKNSIYYLKINKIIQFFNTSYISKNITIDNVSEIYYDEIMSNDEIQLYLSMKIKNMMECQTSDIFYFLNILETKQQESKDIIYIGRLLNTVIKSLC